jgi:hypothetical protein
MEEENDKPLKILRPFLKKAPQGLQRPEAEAPARQDGMVRLQRRHTRGNASHNVTSAVRFRRSYSRSVSVVPEHAVPRRK